MTEKIIILYYSIQIKIPVRYCVYSTAIRMFLARFVSVDWHLDILDNNIMLIILEIPYGTVL